MDNLATFFSQYGGISLAILATVWGYGRLNQKTEANTKAIDDLKGDIKTISGGLIEVRVQAAKTDAKVDMILQILEKKA